MKKTLSEEYSFLEFVKYLIILSVVIGTIFFLKSIVEQLEFISRSGNSLILITQIILYILVLVSSVSGIMVINFLFKLDKTKNNLEGEKTKYYENGQKKYEHTYKDGEKDGIWTEWYENGQKKEEGTFKDGKLEGLVTGWYENGQRMGEYTYKDGKLISKKEWNEDGSVME